MAKIYSLLTALTVTNQSYAEATILWGSFVFLSARARGGEGGVVVVAATRLPLFRRRGAHSQVTFAHLPQLNYSINATFRSPSETATSVIRNVDGDA